MSASKFPMLVAFSNSPVIESCFYFISGANFVSASDITLCFKQIGRLSNRGREGFPSLIYFLIDYFFYSIIFKMLPYCYFNFESLVDLSWVSLFWILLKPNSSSSLLFFVAVSKTVGFDFFTSDTASVKLDLMAFSLVSNYWSKVPAVFLNCSWTLSANFGVVVSRYSSAFSATKYLHTYPP